MTFFQRILGSVKTVVNAIVPFADVIPGVAPVADSIQSFINKYDPEPAYPVTDPTIVDVEHLVAEGTTLYTDVVTDANGYAAAATFSLGGQPCTLLVVRNSGTLGTQLGLGAS